MGILKQDSSKIILLLAVCCLVPKMRGDFDGYDAAVKKLAATYDLSDPLSKTEAESAVRGLRQELDSCANDELCFRIKYRIGMIYFKAGLFEEANKEFSAISDTPECPRMVRFCSLNMAGQINRMQGRKEDALEAFETLAASIQKNLVSNQRESGGAVVELWYSAVSSRAEIYESLRKWGSSIEEYSRILDPSFRSGQAQLEQYEMLARDRICRISLQQGDVDTYKQNTSILCEKYPSYYRSAIIEFEQTCVGFVKSNNIDYNWTNGRTGAPAAVINYLKDTVSRGDNEAILSKLSTLCAREGNETYAGVVLNYHRVWLLEALGRKEQAAKVLEDIASAGLSEMGAGSCPRRIAETIREYSKVQCALLLGEMGKYSEALLVLGDSSEDSDKSQVSELAKNVRDGIETLRREENPIEKE